MVRACSHFGLPASAHVPTIRTLLLGLACPRIRSPNTLYRALKYVSIDYNYVYIAAGTVCQVFQSLSWSAATLESF